MKKYMRKLAILLALAFLLCGCAVPSGTTGSQATVKNIFAPTTTAVLTDTEPEISQPIEPTTAEPVLGGGMGWEIPGRAVDENGIKSLPYTGGEMTMPLHVYGHGIIAAYGIGILMFVDGKPQAYRTSENEEYKYMHTFTKDTYPVKEYPDDTKYDEITIDTSLIFTPVAGKEGEYVSCQLISILDPEFSPAEWGILGTMGHKLTSGYMLLDTYLRCEVNPPETEMFPVQDRLYDLEITTAEVTAEEIKGWTDDDILKNNRHRIYVNDRDLDAMASGWTYGVTEDTEIRLRFEVWGSPYIHYGLVFFMDNQPISVAEEDIIMIGIESGKKTIVNVKVDISGFDGESHIYCVLVSRNYYEYLGQYMFAGTIVTSYDFLFDDPDPKG